jgi:S-DNA-T family DNA segregation ATPase FtsK/SpoIIIE
MVVGTLVGAAMILPSIVYPLYNTPKRQFKRVLKASFHTHNLDTELRSISITKLEGTDYGFYAEIILPSGLTVEQFKAYLPAIEQDTYSNIRFRHLRGRHCSLDFGRMGLHNRIDYKDAKKEGLKIPFLTAFGWKMLDIQDGSSCHIVGGGATRMGKTVLQLMTAAHLYAQSKGQIKMVIISAKDADYYMFRNLPNVSLVTPDKALKHLDDAIQEYKDRKAVIDELGNVNDAKTVKERYPDKAFQPFVVIVDEVGVFGKTADKEQQAYNTAVQEAMTEVAERAGYVDVHLVIFSQRPDAKDVLNPRIKTNMLVKIALTTANEADSKIILGMEGAEKLGGIKGRAILVDGLPETVQIPYLSNDEAEVLLMPYYRKRKEDVQNDHKGQIDSETITPLPSFITGPVRNIDLPGSSETICYDQPHHEKIVSGWGRLADTPAQR